MEGLPKEAATQFGAHQEARLDLGLHRQEVGDPAQGVVVGETERRQSGFVREGCQADLRVRAVGMGGMAVEIDHALGPPGSLLLAR